MMDRRSLLTAATRLAPLLAVPGLARAAGEPAKQAGAKTEEAAKKADFLFVQNVHGIHYADGEPTLKDVRPTSDPVLRPPRADRRPHGHRPVRAVLVEGQRPLPGRSA